MISPFSSRSTTIGASAATHFRTCSQPTPNARQISDMLRSTTGT
ncbi:MAG: hypothetical protein ACLSHC_17410 [Bilophila wadsworthia]